MVAHTTLVTDEDLSFRKHMSNLTISVDMSNCLKQIILLVSHHMLSYSNNIYIKSLTVIGGPTKNDQLYVSKYTFCAFVSTLNA